MEIFLKSNTTIEFLYLRLCFGSKLTGTWQVACEQQNTKHTSNNTIINKRFHL